MSETLLNGEPGGGEPPANTPPAEPSNATPAPFSLYGEDGLNDGLNAIIGEGDDYKGARAFFKKYAGAEDPTKESMRGLENLTYLASQKGFERPADDAPDNVKEAYVKKIKEVMRTPQTAEEYGFKRPEDLDESIPVNDEELKAFADILLKHHASPELADDLRDTYFDFARNVPDMAAAAQQEALAGELTKLKDVEGLNADKVVTQATSFARTVVQNIAGEEFQAELDRWGQTADGARLMSRLLSSFSSDSIAGGTGADGINAGEGKSNLELAQEQAALGAKAAAKGDMAAVDRHYKLQQEYNQRHIATGR